jgi:nucleolar pre-ribosomal-associated protein 1
MTTSLLRKLLLVSIMFEHDHGELEIWLDALPALSSAGDITQRAFLIAQQIHLLSFLDECVRRCMKTPFRYIEDVTSLVPDYFSPMERPHELITPLIMTIVEQLRAKIMGQLISTEAAGVVMGYLKRVIVGLSGKMTDGRWLLALLSNVEEAVKAAREKGQERKGLLGSVQQIQIALVQIFGGQQVEVAEEPAVSMIDEE